LTHTVSHRPITGVGLRLSQVKMSVLPMVCKASESNTRVYVKRHLGFIQPKTELAPFDLPTPKTHPRTKRSG